jgi:MATE family, multidrug efflux pump
VALSVPIALVLLTVRPVLELTGQPPEVIPGAAGFVYRNALSVLPFYVFVVLRQTLQAHHRVLSIGITVIVANIVNVGLNYIWIFGHLGFPPMGVIGSAWATTVSRWLMAALMLLLGWVRCGHTCARWRRICSMSGRWCGCSSSVRRSASR